MAIQCVDTTTTVNRPFTSVNYATGDWTQGVWVRYPVTPTGADYYTTWMIFTDATNYIGSYNYLNGGPYEQTWEGQLNGGLYTFFVTAAATAEIWQYLVYRYTAATTTLDIFIITAAGVLTHASAVVSLAAMLPIIGQNIGGDGNTPNLAGLEFTQWRTWQAALSFEAILNEAFSTTPVTTTGLLSNCTFASASDLDDAVGGASSWGVAVGSIATVDDPPQRLTSILCADLFCIPAPTGDGCPVPNSFGNS